MPESLGLDAGPPSRMHYSENQILTSGVLMTKANQLNNQTTSDLSSKPKLATLACALGLIILVVLYAKIIGL
jgi:hypothetical protein